jgi:endo-1,4-beta-xylanase
LTATIANGTALGTNFTRDFDIIISPAVIFVAVTGISKVPTGGTEGVQVDLNVVEVAPDTATNKTIAWTVKSAGTTGVGNANIVDRKFTPATAGTLTLTATIANGAAQGTAFTRDFDIIISPANTFVAVANITGVPDSGEVGNEVDLTAATVVPDTANNKTIVWTVKDPGATGLTTADIVSGKFTATAPGTVKLTATIADGTAEGTNYARDFDIIISVPGSFVPVTNITGVPEEGTVGSLVSLAEATVIPNTATYKTIAWRVTSDGVGLSLGVLDGNSFTPTSAGTVGLTAYILSGAGNMAPYSQEFEITINPAFVPVSGISGLPETLNAVTGEPINLNAGITVMPTDATTKTIVWSVEAAGETGRTSANVASGSFTPSKDGTAILTATILNGLAQGNNYTQGIVITIIEPVTGISNIPTNGTKGYAVDLTGALVAPGTATNKTIVWTVAANDNGNVGITDADLTTGIFTPANTGTLRLTATIVDGTAVGTNYTRNATITINEPGETTPGIGLGEDTSIVLKDKNGAPLSKDWVNEIALNDNTYFVYISGYTDIVWRINGTVQDVTTDLIYPPVSTARKITIAAVGRKNGKLESTGTYTFEIK